MIVGAAGSTAVAGCSSDSASPAGGGDASTVDAMSEASAHPNEAAAAPIPVGDPTTDCNACTVCGGVLLSATTGISYCTADCTTTADCPSGTACIPNITSAVLGNQCIETCAADSDCTAPFVCRVDVPTPGGYCWSPYPPRTDAATPFPVEAGADAGADAGGLPDAGVDDANVSDAPAADAADALPE
jgi:hypothetical protein